MGMVEGFDPITMDEKIDEIEITKTIRTNSDIRIKARQVTAVNGGFWPVDATKKKDDSTTVRRVDRVLSMG